LTTKKGIVVTVLILAAITAASFLVWLIPQNNEDKIIVSDFKTHLDNIKEIHFTLQAEVDQEFQNMLDKKITPKEYIQIAEATSSQVNSQIIQLVESKAPVEWHESYLNYIEALKKFNSEIRETIVVATLMNENNELMEFQDNLEKINS
jgi:CHAT domain-containing protein